MNLVKMKFLPELGPQFMELDMIWIGSFKYSLNPSSPIISYLLARSQCFLFPLANRNSSKSLISHLIDQAVLSSAEFPYSANPLKYYSYSEIIGKLKKHYIKSSVAGCQCNVSLRERGELFSNSPPKKGHKLVLLIKRKNNKIINIS